jgi:sugar phosphate isomerase/epimerase
MRLGIGSYTYVWAVGVPGYPAPECPLTSEQLLEKAAALGVHVVQFADNLPLDRLSRPERAALKRCAEDLAIDIEVGTRGVGHAHLLRYVDLAQEFGSAIVRIVLDTDEHRPEADEVVSALRALAPALERAKIALAIENHDRFRAATLAEIIERGESPQVGICLDTANSIGCVENLETLMRNLGQRVVNLHVKDYQIERLPHQKGFVVKGRPVGRGQLDILWLLAELRRLGRNPNAIVELWPPPEPTIAASVAKEDAWAAESVRYLRQLIAD